MRHVIIGGSIAGITAARAIRDSDAGAEITMISREGSKAYYRPLIPLLIEEEGADIGFVDDPVEACRAVAVVDEAFAVDPGAKEVHLSSGNRISYDRLLLATGARPVIPDIAGIEAQGVFTLRTREDASRIRAHAAGTKEAVVLGGGLVGIKAASALRGLGLDVTIIEERGQLLYQRVDSRGAGIVSDALREAGITVLTETTITEVMVKGETLEAVRLSTGRTLTAGTAVIAAGVRPETGVTSAAGIRTAAGVLVDGHLRTSIPDIYAAGDVVEYRDVVTGLPALSALWTNAVETGRIAGMNMAGADITCEGFLSVMNAVDVFGVPVISAGLVAPGKGDYETITREDPGSYRRLVFNGEVLAGAVFIGDVTAAGLYVNLIKNRIPLGPLKDRAVKGSLGYADLLSLRA